MYGTRRRNLELEEDSEYFRLVEATAKRLRQRQVIAIESLNVMNSYTKQLISTRKCLLPEHGW